MVHLVGHNLFYHHGNQAQTFIHPENLDIMAMKSQIIFLSWPPQCFLTVVLVI